MKRNGIRDNGADADASFALVFTAKRQTGYFIFQIIFPLALVVAMFWIVFWIDPAKFDTQIGVATTAVLTLTASCLRIVAPFIGALTWAGIIAIAAGTLALGFPRGSRATLPFGCLRVPCPAGEIY